MTAQTVNNLVDNTPVELPSWLGANLSARLAMDLAMQIHPIPLVMSRYGLEPNDLAVLLHTPAFQQMVRAARQEWESDLKAIDRIRIKSAVALEDSIETVYHMVHNERAPISARLDGVKTLAKLAKADNALEGGGVVPFSVVIDLGDRDRIEVTTQAPIIEHDE